MARSLRLDSQVSVPALAGLLSATLHLGLFLVIAFSGGRYDGIHDGDTPITHLVLIEARKANHVEGVEAPLLEPMLPTADFAVQLQVQATEPPLLLLQDSYPEPADGPAVLPPEPAATIPSVSIDASSTVVMSEAEASALLAQVARAAETLASAPRTQVAWQQNAKRYSATLVLQRAQDGDALDRVIAEVSAEDRGRQLKTRIKLKRLAFSSYTQMVDRWDPRVQLHDDEIDGRSHINSQFNLMYDRRTAPKFLGKVTTAARTFNTESIGRRREKDIFRGGVETRAGRIALPDRIHPFDWAPREENARIHEIAHDTRIRFFADGSYTWLDLDTRRSEYRNDPTEQPVYFIARRGATLYVKGVLSGKVLIYSPDRIIVEGSLTYAHDPRDDPGSRDYLGLVSDRSIQLASHGVTGPGDISIHAAIFARRSFIVTDIDHPHTGTLRIYGSLSAGTLSATEPRFATKIEYDHRFEERRPPGFPATNRFAVEEWAGVWTASGPAADGDAVEHTIVTDVRAAD
ncbi:MAG TPA: hypothetical protein VJS42_09975 [Steroidobacteraceae bacterium]|nr:hypothetical protein [Steroidobacteraceae bacterium]